MSGLVLRIDAEGFQKLVGVIDKLEARIPRAIAFGMNEGGDKVRTRVMRTLRDQTGVKNYSSITSRVRTSRAFGEGDRIGASDHGAAAQGASLTYQIIATGKGIPIKEFPVSLTSSGVDARPWGVDHLFKRSFGIKGRGVDGFRARTTSKRFPIRKLFGPALPKELEKGSVPSVFYLSAAAFVPPAIMKQLARVM